MRLFKDVKNFKKNWKAVQSSPYASLSFKYKTTLTTICLFSAFIIYQIIKITLNYSGQGVMTWVMRAFTLGIGVLIVFKAFGTLAPIKRAMEPYKKNRELINHVTTDAKVEIDDILNQFDDDGKRINNHSGEEELNKHRKR